MKREHFLIQNKLVKALNDNGFEVSVKFIFKDDLLNKLLIFGTINLEKLWIDTGKDRYLMDLITQSKIVTIKNILPKVILKYKTAHRDESIELRVAQERIQKILDEIVDNHLLQL